jgi:hypothetical protein
MTSRTHLSAENGNVGGSGAEELALLDEIAAAWADEWDRWLYRDATWLSENRGRAGHEVCRADDSGFAGEFSEVHRFGSAGEAKDALGDLRDRACARRVLALATGNAEPAPG